MVVPAYLDIMYSVDATECATKAGEAGVMRFRWWLWAVILVAVAAETQAASAQSIGWQEAVARLAAERTRAETCASLLKQHGDEAAISRGELAYGEAKAEVDAVIAGLVVALAEDNEPESLPDLEERLKRGVTAREAFCREVMPLVPDTTGVKSGIIDVLGEVLTPLIDAVKAIYLDFREEDRLTRKTIQTQLEATKWPAFASIPR